jgi:host factor-I protein
MAVAKAGVKKTKAAKKSKGTERAPPAQHRFLADMAKERRPVAIFLVNGLKLEGKIASFDDYAILLEGEMSDHVYKHAISTIQPLTQAAAKSAGAVKKSAPLALAEADAGVIAKPRTPRQPTIVVRTKRRVVRSTDDN